jgi:hypothetical protein
MCCGASIPNRTLSPTTARTLTSIRSGPSPIKNDSPGRLVMISMAVCPLQSVSSCCRLYVYVIQTRCHSTRTGAGTEGVATEEETASVYEKSVTAWWPDVRDRGGRSTLQATGSLTVTSKILRKCSLSTAGDRAEREYAMAPIVPDYPDSRTFYGIVLHT